MSKQCLILQKKIGTIISHEAEKHTFQPTTHTPNECVFNIGESGLGIRLVFPVLSALGGVFTIEAEGSLLKRPMSQFDSLLKGHGMEVSTSNGYAPIFLRGKMDSGFYVMDGSYGSQLVSGMLMALPLLKGDSTLQVRNLNSVPYVQMTLDVLNEAGIYIEHDGFKNFAIKGYQSYQGIDICIEKDWSSASFWLVAAALGHDIRLNGLNLKSAQADVGILNALRNAGCTIWEEATMLSCSEAKNPFVFDATHCPDLFPPLVCLAAFMEGKSTLVGAERLKHKESNRALTLQSEFRTLGVNIALDGDLMHIFGTGKVNGGKVQSHNDHRIAMALAIAGLNAEDSIKISGAESVYKSYPTFWEDLEKLTTT